MLALCLDLLDLTSLFGQVISNFFDCFEERVVFVLGYLQSVLLPLTDLIRQHPGLSIAILIVEELTSLVQSIAQVVHFLLELRLVIGQGIGGRVFIVCLETGGCCFHE